MWHVSCIMFSSSSEVRRQMLALAEVEMMFLPCSKSFAKVRCLAHVGEHWNAQ